MTSQDEADIYSFVTIGNYKEIEQINMKNASNLKLSTTRVLVV